MATERDMGAVSSYAEAVIGGYTGTVAQWRSLLANLPQEPYCATVGRNDEYDKCWTAFSAKRVVFAQFLISLTLTALPLTRVDANDVMYFTGVIGGKLITWTLTDQNIWSTTETTLATSSDIPSGADDIAYDNTTSGMAADDVQEAIDELSAAAKNVPLVVTATATWQAGTGALTSFTITGGQSETDIIDAVTAGRSVILDVDDATYVLAGKSSSLQSQLILYFTLTYAGAVRQFVMSQAQAEPHACTWAHQKVYYQTTGNLVTSLSGSSTDSQYPSAKCVYDLVGDVESLLAAI